MDKIIKYEDHAIVQIDETSYKISIRKHKKKKVICISKLSLDGYDQIHVLPVVSNQIFIK